MSEFDLIATYFTWDDIDKQSIKPTENKTTSKIIKSVGDDAAVLSLAPERQLVTSIDTLVSDVHFPVNTAAFDIGHKALAVNLSDLAAMGAKPEWFTLALTLPEINHDWLIEFSHGLKSLATQAGISLVGGDTTSGPLAISIQVMGSVEKNKALYRSGAKSGDKIYVTGTLGDGAAGLASLQNKLEMDANHANYCQQRLNRPSPRNLESDLIKDYASACMDISDGLIQDLSHILKQSNAIDKMQTLGAQLDLSTIPLSPALNSIHYQSAINFALTGGDDYELLFTIAESIEADFLEMSRSSDFSFTWIGTITSQKGIIDTNNNALNTTGYNHFS